MGDCDCEAVRRCECDCEAVRRCECDCEAVRRCECDCEAVRRCECDCETVRRCECDCEEVIVLDYMYTVLCVLYMSIVDLGRRSRPLRAVSPCALARGPQSPPSVSLPPPSPSAPADPTSPDPASWWTLPTLVCVASNPRLLLPLTCANNLTTLLLPPSL